MTKRAFNIDTNKEFQPGDKVEIHKMNDAGLWVSTGEFGVFEEATKYGLMNFSHNGKPRQCMPGGINAIWA